MYSVTGDSQAKFRPKWDFRNWLLILCLITLLVALVRTPTQLGGTDRNVLSQGTEARRKGGERTAQLALNLHFAQILKTLMQIAATAPASALFFVILLVLAQQDGGLQLGSIVLMMLGLMWYVLFNVIAGAQSIYSQLLEAARVDKLSRWQWWKSVMLSGIFSDVITGMITARFGAITMPVLSAHTSA